jgi:tripartite ATP-independent transporter DctP family solute receptor
MMMLKKFRCLALVIALVLVFVSCTTFAAKKPIKIVYGHILTMDHYNVKGDQYFKKLVEKNSKGQIIIDYYPASQLGSGTEQSQAVMSGAQQMFLGGVGVFAQTWPKIGTIELPYLIRDQEHYLKVASKLPSLLGRNEMASKLGVRILGVRLNSPRQLTTKFPVNKVEDINGLKLRLSETASWVACWKALGAIPTVIPMADLYTSLATGVVDAQENPFDTIYAAKLYEQVKYCALTSHIRGYYLVLINNGFWKKLTPKHQKIISAAAAKADQMMRKAALDGEEKYYQLLVKAGMKFTKPDLIPFRKKAKTVWSQFGDVELIKKIEAVK